MSNPFTLGRIVQFIGLVVFMVAAIQGLVLHLNGLSMPASQFVNEHLWEAAYTWVSLVLGITGMFVGASQRQSVPSTASA